MVVLVPGHVRAVLQLAGKTTQVQYTTVWTNVSAGTLSREGCPTAGKQNYPWTNGSAGTWSREGCPTAGRSSLGRYVFGSEISYNKAPPRLPGLGC